MDVDLILSFLHGWAFLLGTFFIALGYSMFKGRQALMNIIVGSYIALLLYQLFPAKAKIEAQVVGDQHPASDALDHLALQHRVYVVNRAGARCARESGFQGRARGSHDEADDREYTLGRRRREDAEAARCARSSLP